jgi:hypothetical protein
MKSVHVVPHRGGGWDIKSRNSDRAAGHFETKAPAVDRARTMSVNQRAELFIHNRDGRIAARDSHGHDPRIRNG